MDKFTIPNALSTSRLILAPLCYLAIMQQAWLVAGLILLLAVATDLADGWLARRLGQVTAMGGLLDHGSDAVFVTVTLAALAAAGIVPAVLPILVILAFTQYVLDSKALAGKPLRASRIGRYNGIAYFVLAGFPLLHWGAGLHIVPAVAFYAAGWLLVASTLISMLDRAIALLRPTSH